MYLRETLMTGALAASVTWWCVSIVAEWIEDRRAVKELGRQFEKFCKTNYYDELSQRWIKIDDPAGQSSAPPAESERSKSAA